MIEYYVIDEDKFLTEYEFRVMLSNVSLPHTIKPEDVEPFGAYQVQVSSPVPSSLTRQMIKTGIEEIDNIWYATWEEVDLDPSVLATKFQRLKETKLLEIRNECSTRIRELTKSYPHYEQNTFHRQEVEARAFLANPGAVTPMLDSLCLYECRDKAEMASAIVQKSDVYADLSGRLIGYRNSLEAQVRAIADPQEIDVVNLIDPSVGWPDLNG